MTIVSSKLRLKLCVLLTSCLRRNSNLLWVRFRIRHQENAKSSTMPTRCVAGLLCVPTHIAMVLVFLRCLGIAAWERNGRNKCIVLERSGIPRRILFFAASISKKTVLSLEQMLELHVRYEWQVSPPNTHRSLFSKSHSCVYNVLKRITWKLQFTCGRSNSISSDCYIIGDFLCVV